MNNEITWNVGENVVNTSFSNTTLKGARQQPLTELPEILMITSYPPRECGIATYSQDLIKALNNKFSNSFSLKVCALESGKMNYNYPEEVKYVLDTNDVPEYTALAKRINSNPHIQSVIVQHEFGFFHQAGEDVFLQFLYQLAKPAIVVFHTVLPNPKDAFKLNVKRIAAACDSIIVMTHNASKILVEDYGVPAQKIEVIAHGTHLVPHLDRDELKVKYNLSGRKVVSTFGLLSSGKSIETTLDALPAIKEQNPDVMFLVIGKTHPGVVKSEGETYRNMLLEKVETLGLQEHVRFVNHYLKLEELLEYLQMTDIYLFTSKDPFQAVSGTFSYAMSCGCPIISTPIPHALELLREDNSIIIDFQNSKQLAAGVIRLLSDDDLRMSFSANVLQQIVPSVWENSAIAHATLLQQVAGKIESGYTRKNTDTPMTYSTPAPAAFKIPLQYRVPEISLEHLKKMTTEVGMIQFAKINQPDIESGYTLDDNARALIAMCMHYKLTANKEDLRAIRQYVDFIQFCQQDAGDFLNYVDKDRNFTTQNDETGLADANGRAIWALGYLVSKNALLPQGIVADAEKMIERSLPYILQMSSPRAMAFAIKGLYYFNKGKKAPVYAAMIKTLADRLVYCFKHEADQDWQWFEGSLTYGNSILPEAMLCAWLVTGQAQYKEIAKSSFDFLLSLTFKNDGIKVISNRTWLHKGQESSEFGEQPIDVAYTVMALSKFYSVFKEEQYSEKMTTAFNWFLGNNHLRQIIYNPCTGGCYDGLEETHVNLNQGAESTLSYLMARFVMEKHIRRAAKTSTSTI